MSDRYNGRGLRSKGTGDPKTDQQAVHLYTASAGPEGPPLRSKYLNHAVKSAKKKTGGNSGGVGRRAIARMRGHGGGQESMEQKRQREAQSTAAQRARAAWMGGEALPEPVAK